MITRDELKAYARQRNLKALGMAEKDYFQSIMLFILYQEYGNELVFKGGTALSKCYGLDRFSEDLDFTLKVKPKLKKLEDGLKRFGLRYEMESSEGEDSIRIVLRVEGPLYTGIRQSLCKFIIDFSLRESVLLKPMVKTIGRFLEEIPSFDVYVMQETEILAEKIRAIATRDKARDIYDLWFLLEKGVRFDAALAGEKLGYYGKEWDAAAFRRQLRAKGAIWQTELGQLVTRVPEFKVVEAAILGAVTGKAHKR